ncbi:hypothetical protein GCM10010129_49800 [Streptomyces fumigatiscleroticus]|nr:hypothetical protein GCM10010129_49800 [Streptomyces fumigatiscleroticus]
MAGAGRGTRSVTGVVPGAADEVRGHRGGADGAAPAAPVAADGADRADGADGADRADGGVRPGATSVTSFRAGVHRATPGRRRLTRVNSA